MGCMYNYSKQEQISSPIFKHRKWGRQKGAGRGTYEESQTHHTEDNAPRG
jgi:hypothetical protein